MKVCLDTSPLRREIEFKVNDMSLVVLIVDATKMTPSYVMRSSQFSIPSVRSLGGQWAFGNCRRSVVDESRYLHSTYLGR